MTSHPLAYDDQALDGGPDVALLFRLIQESGRPFTFSGPEDWHRIHGNDAIMVDDEAGAVLRFFTELKQHLMPYLLDVGAEANQYGYPMMRAMVLEFPDDLTCRYLVDEILIELMYHHSRPRKSQDVIIIYPCVMLRCACCRSSPSSR